MIAVQDNFFQPETLKSIQEYCQQDFILKKTKEKDFLVLATPTDLYPILKIKGHEIVLSFIRQAHKDFDNEPRIHCDHIIEGKRTSLARVFYINEQEGVSKSGTAFFTNKKWGLRAPEDLSNEEFDRLITEESGNESKWVKTDYISARPNRMLTYNSSYWHAKYPFKVEEGVRKVLVVFYTKI